jgi:hypothetical protein
MKALIQSVGYECPEYNVGGYYVHGPATNLITMLCRDKSGNEFDITYRGSQLFDSATDLEDIDVEITFKHRPRNPTKETTTFK